MLQVRILRNRKMNCLSLQYLEREQDVIQFSHSVINTRTEYTLRTRQHRAGTVTAGRTFGKTSQVLISYAWPQTR